MNKILLLILDGWGCRENYEGNAVYRASTPAYDRLMKNYPSSLLEASGESVGLPEGQMGNSEVGHLNLGSGRIVYQELTRINMCIRTGEFFTNRVLVDTMARAKAGGGALHIAGLVSDGGVHSHIDHLSALLTLAEQEGVPELYIHAILDGRDTAPFSAAKWLEQLEQRAQERGRGRIATVSGRYYAMDRDRRWDRTERAYRAMVYGEGLSAPTAREALSRAYERSEGDEFVQPTVIVNSGGVPVAKVGSADQVIFFNFRPDRARQISKAFIDEQFTDFDRGADPAFPGYVTMTRYERDFPVPVAFTLDDLENTLGETYSRLGLAQVRIAETEKYAHVTFFFNGGREKPFAGEDRILVPSPKVATYDLQPEMSAAGVTEKIVETVRGGRHSLVIANYANADMVGHSGKIDAAVQAVEAVDRGLAEVAAAVEDCGWLMLVTADHGNAEEMLGPKGEAITAHSSNPVPLILVGAGQWKLRERGILADIAPTILELAGQKAPAEMSGRSMIV